MTAIDADLCIIGAGSGGLSVAAGAAQLGRKVALIEKAEMGGDCLNFGCVPSKALIAAARRAHDARDAKHLGVQAEVSIDFHAVIDHVRRVIAAIEPHDSQERFEKLGCTVIRAAAAFTGPREVAAGSVTVRAKHFVVATGSSPLIPAIEGLSHVPYFTNETIFLNRHQPEHLIVLGGGPIGCELAQAFRRLGSRVTLVEAQRILGREDPEAAAVVRESLVSDGVAILEGSAVVRASGTADSVTLDIADGRNVRGSHLLVAVGRKANVENLGLDKAGVAFTHKGVTVDQRLRTTNKRIYAIGDCAGGAQFTHVAGDHASTIVRNILFKAPARRRDAIAPRATYTAPEIAAVGLSDADAANVVGARTLRWSFTENDRAQAEEAIEGFGKIVTDAKGKILGATIVGENAGDLIHIFAFAVANKMGVRAFTNYIAPYPTRGEIAKRLGGAWYTQTLFSDRTRGLVRALATFD